VGKRHSAQPTEFEVLCRFDPMNLQLATWPGKLIKISLGPTFSTEETRSFCLARLEFRDRLFVFFATMYPSLLLSLLATPLAVFAAPAVEIVPRQIAASCSIDTLIKAKGKMYCGVATDKNSLTARINATTTGVVGLVLFNFAWNQTEVGWKVPCTYILRVMAILFFAAFMYFEIYVARHILVPINILSQEAVFALSIVQHGWASFGIWGYYLWQLIENLRHDSVLSSTAQQIPVTLSGIDSCGVLDVQNQSCVDDACRNGLF
jgi:hypothetical protein